MTTQNLALPTLGTIAAALPAAIVPNAALIASELVRFADEADRAEGIAARAVIEDEEAAGRGADVIRSVNDLLKTIETARKEKTAPYDQDKRTLTALYGSIAARLEAAKTVLSNKVLGYSRAETARRIAEAARRELAQREQAQRLAAAQAAIGDEEGAEQIIADAVASTPVAEKVVAKGFYGAAGGERKRPVGAITDLKAFLVWVVSSGYEELLSEISIGQRGLNVLAKNVLENDGATVPGFKAEYDSSFTVR